MFITWGREEMVQKMLVIVSNAIKNNLSSASVHILAKVGADNAWYPSRADRQKKVSSLSLLTVLQPPPGR
jgi:hypothetical protein